MTSSTGLHLNICRQFSLAEMQLATGNFDDENELGSGGSGTVYKGRLNDGSDVAVKRVKRPVSNSNKGQREKERERERERQFVTEMETLSELRHNNLVSLIGYCNEQGEMIIVYEYLPNGTLAYHLHRNNHDRRPSLTWNQRMKICIDSAQGLDYLHRGRSVIHRDVKPTNILLGDNLTAKVSDFGLAKTLNLGQSHVTTIVKGTPGYFDPLYFNSRQLTKASDTYSFGVVLLEILSGRPAIDDNLAENELCLVMWAQEKIKNRKFHEIVDSSIREEISKGCLKTYVGVVKSCLDNDPAKRPSMKKVLAQLEAALEQQERKESALKLKSRPLKAFWNRIVPSGKTDGKEMSVPQPDLVEDPQPLVEDTQFQFNQEDSDWGFMRFIPLSELSDPNKGYIVNDTCVVEADVAVRQIIHSKKETVYVGLKNQGATAYMNSSLQTLYHIPYFRKAVYHMPTTENDNPTGTSIPLAIQSLFYKLQYNDTSVATKELTKSFGWDTDDSLMAHDAHEFYRVLSERLEDKMKGTVVEGTIQKLFEGHHMTYVECINVDFKSTRKESFYDLQLDLKGCKDVYASFDKYVEVERLEGDNKYHAEELGLQDAKKGVLFSDFPPVLRLQLKRYEYDSMRDTMVKINDRYKFPLELDLDRDNGKYLSPEADRSVPNIYALHSVLVHSGGVHGGHYYAFIRPTLTDQWYKFNDEVVTEEDVKRAIEEQYGGYNNSNAYILMYIRVSDKDKIICDVDEKDVAEHLRIRLKKVQEEKEDKRRRKAEARLHTIIKVARDEDLREQIGKDIYFDLVDHDKVRNFQFQKRKPFNLLKEEFAKEFGIPVQLQRFWIWAKRQNYTYRPNRPLTPREEALTVGELREVPNKANNSELKLFLEVERGPDLQLLPLPIKTKEDILLFFKLYDPLKEELRYVGRLYVRSYGKPVEILKKLNELAGFAPDEEIDLFEEIKFEPNVMCERLDVGISFRLSQIEDGDIICFQKRPSPNNEEHVRFPDVPSFLEYVKKEMKKGT